jgi:hypothetical protein
MAFFVFFSKTAGSLRKTAGRPAPENIENLEMCVTLPIFGDKGSGKKFTLWNPPT